MKQPERPEFGKAAGKPPSWFARVPTRAIWNTRAYRKRKKRGGITPTELFVLNVITAYANEQGFAWPNLKTIGEVVGTDATIVAHDVRKLVKKGYIKKISQHRSHPKWKHVLGAVYRVVHDEEVDDDELIDRMDHDDPAPIQEEDLPPQGKQSGRLEGDELAEVVGGTRMAWWFARLVGDRMGVVRLVNPRAVEAAVKALELHGGDEDRLKARAEKRIAVCLAERRDPPHHLGWLT